MHDPHYQALVSLVELFENDLSRVSFPDVSGNSLRAAADAVEERRQAVLAAEASLRAARDSLDESRRSFERLGRRALAYARIYADGDTEISASLGALGRAIDVAKPEAAGAEAPKKRGRPRKSDTGLFEVDVSSETLEDGRECDEVALAQSA